MRIYLFQPTRVSVHATSSSAKNKSRGSGQKCISNTAVILLVYIPWQGFDFFDISLPTMRIYVYMLKAYPASSVSFLSEFRPEEGRVWTLDRLLAMDSWRSRRCPWTT